VLSVHLFEICADCCVTGHWIQECPSIEDPNWDSKRRITRTTGIPRAFLQAVDSTEAGDNVMVTADGSFVIARPDSTSWDLHRAIAPNLSADEVKNSQPTDPDLTCPICSKLLRDAVVTPCCGTAFCDDCIRTSLARNNNACPECETRLKSPSQLKVDDDRRRRVAEYVAEMVRAGKEAAKEEGDDSPADGAESSKAATPIPPSNGEVKVEEEVRRFTVG
jgi:protein MPE1